ncbi:hypothetical protein EVAR_43758_1 [Eumeta japonica]|uniref:Reverse transcriptase domain-containing protein n=1 Tax=Eumeta variegata TaxID=151549 RepID=A0A4C1XIS4_EUMVA|nr:hypothetical protein EVAR_43758_1 [Eumeta japonica]
MDELSAKCLLYADNQVIFAPWAFELEEMVTKMEKSIQHSVTEHNGDRGTRAVVGYRTPASGFRPRNPLRLQRCRFQVMLRRNVKRSGI